MPVLETVTNVGAVFWPLQQLNTSASQLNLFLVIIASMLQVRKQNEQWTSGSKLRQTQPLSIFNYTKPRVLNMSENSALSTALNYLQKKNNSKEPKPEET